MNTFTAETQSTQSKRRGIQAHLGGPLRSLRLCGEGFCFFRVSQAPVGARRSRRNDLRYKVNGSAEMTEYALVRTSQRLLPLWCEPA